MSRVAGFAMSLILLGATLIGVPAQDAAAALPSGFAEQIVFTGLDQPTNVEFSPDGRVFVAEKSGRIKVFDSLADSTPALYADLSANVHNVGDRGLLGLVLHPDFPQTPWIYVLYAYDAPPGSTAPYWGDNCNSVGGMHSGRCVVTSRLSRVDPSGFEQVLVHDWCQQFPSHSTGDIKFGEDGMLYATGGDGASWSDVDFGQHGNPCGDPVSEGGALRSQDVATTGDPVGLNGTMIRVDPVTGQAASGNPWASSSDPNTRRIVAYGLRNPYRLTTRPGTGELWIGDVGWGTWEEVERVTDPRGAVTNFGWPCYEAQDATSYQSLGSPLCEALVGATPPHFAYKHAGDVVPGESCVIGGYSISGLAFYPSGGSYPSAYHGALFFADYARGCIAAMRPASSGGVPDVGAIEAFASQAAMPVDLEVGPGGDLYYVDLGGTVRRFRYFEANQPPTAAINIVETGLPGLTERFDASGSTDNDPADAERLTYEWDFTNDGSFDTTGVTAEYTHPNTDPYTVRLRVTDTLDASDEETMLVLPGISAPVATIDGPSTNLNWEVGQVIPFSGQSDHTESTLGWQLRLKHCEVANSCHAHPIQTWEGVSGGSFVAPDHDYPAYLELALTATDPNGLKHTTVRRLDPRTVTLTFNTQPSGLRLSVGSRTGVTPFSVEMIEGSTKTVSAPSPQTKVVARYGFSSWSDHGAQIHVITANAAATRSAAFFRCSGWIRFIRPAACWPPKPPIVRRHTPY